MNVRLLLCLGIMAVSCAPGGFTKDESLIISRSSVPMYVTTFQADSAVLRTPAKDLGPAELRSPLLDTLLKKMLATVTHPSQDGVGIAAPQVGISRRLVLVQRLDKEGEPFEAYLNIRIDSLSGPVSVGPEGCLSVPAMRGLVPRRSRVAISYLRPSDRLGERVSEEIEGYTAIIFQHECDHLDGILYIDRADTVFVSPQWAAEREAYDYSRPEWWP